LCASKLSIFGSEIDETEYSRNILFSKDIGLITQKRGGSRRESEQMWMFSILLLIFMWNVNSACRVCGNSYEGVGIIKRINTCMEECD